MARGAAAAAGLVLAAGVLVSACANNGTSLAEQACVHVHASIRLYTRAEHATTRTTATREARRATVELEKAEPLAARANDANPVFNPLMTTLQEVGRTSESNLIPALQAQCDAASNPSSLNQVPSGPAPTTSPG